MSVKTRNGARRRFGAGAGLMVRGIRWRLASSLLTVAAATLAFAASFVAPLYLRAAGDSVVRSAIAATPAFEAGVTLAGSGQPASAAQIHAAEQVVTAAGGPHRWYGDPVTAVSTGVLIAAKKPTAYPSAFYFQTGICAHVTLRSGTCDLGSRTVLLSDRSAAVLGVAVGDTVNLSIRGVPAPRQFSVAGIYAVPNEQATYWWGNGSGIFDYGAHVANHAPSLDSLIVSMSTALAVPPQALPFVSGELPLLSGRVTLASEGSFLHEFNAVKVESVPLNYSDFRAA